ncbi:MAG: GTPase ObgE [Clostridia bacterium]|jgi:GTP-binding protein
MFIDSAKIFIKSGNGGNGVVSFHREKYVPNGGPDGGDGGRGGDVIFLVDDSIRTLADFRYVRKYIADNGDNGGAGNCSGKGGESLVIKVPAGTIVKDAESGAIIADLTKNGDTRIIAKGGKGGAGNQHFATPTRQIPNFAKSGNPGEEHWIKLELKLLADVGLIGFPNVGKSTILSMVSKATPKIADYHFTTIDPNLGVVRLGESSSFVLADIPGLIEGANKGVGLGHDFLRHIERTKLLIHVVDVAGVEGRDPLADFETINDELEKYNPIIAKRPQVVAANKMDALYDKEYYETFKNAVEAKGYKVFPVSAAENKGLKELMSYVFEELKELPESIIENPTETEVVYKAEAEEPFKIHRENEAFVVTGKWVKKLVDSTNFTDFDSLQYFQRSIKKKGIIEELEKMGIKEGSTVKMYELEFDFVE